jgi:hypothetical protein
VDDLLTGLLSVGIGLLALGLGLMLVGAGLSFVTYTVETVVTGTQWDATEALKSTAVGAVVGATAGATLGASAWVMAQAPAAAAGRALASGALRLNAGMVTAATGFTATT